MVALLTARPVEASYENFVTKCPHCGRVNTFNRASDLKTFEPIAGMGVRCLFPECHMPFRIVGDTVNEPYELLIFEAQELIERKHYMNSILTLCQAYEIFFNLHLRATLLFRPFEHDRDAERLRRLDSSLFEKTKRFGFTDMRACFLRLVVQEVNPRNFAEAEAAIAQIKRGPCPDEDEIRSLPDRKLAEPLLFLRNTKINGLRNRIVHKDAYRPRRDEVESFLKEARSILFSLGRRLRVQSSISDYL